MDSILLIHNTIKGHSGFFFGSKKLVRSIGQRQLYGIGDMGD